MIEKLEKFTIQNVSLNAALEENAAIEENATIEEVIYCGGRSRRAAVEEQSCVLFSIKYTSY